MGKPIKVRDSINYKPLEYTKVYHMKPIMLDAQTRADYEAYSTLRDMDPNRDGLITRDEFKRRYPLLGWNTFKSSATQLITCSTRLRATKSTGTRNSILQQCKAHTRGSARILQQFSKLGRTKLGAAGSSYDLGNRRMVITTAREEVKVQFNRLHPAKSAQQRARGNSVILTVTHFSGKKSTFVIKKNGKIIHIRNGNHAKIGERIDLTKSVTHPLSRR